MLLFHLLVYKKENKYTEHRMPIPNFQPQHAETQPTDQQQQQNPTETQPTGAGINTGAGTTREKTAEELEADRLYEEAMEDEYAKREGGA